MNLHTISSIIENIDELRGIDITIQCRIQSEPRFGDDGGSKKTLFEVDDPTGDVPSPVVLSFWHGDSNYDGIREAAPHLLDTVGRKKNDTGGLMRGERVLVRGTPKLIDHEGSEKLFINATDVLIRSPDLTIGKSELRSQARCPREYYLSYVKRVYRGKKHLNRSRYRGDVVHRVVERALDEQQDTFRSNDWTDDDVTEFVTTVLYEEFGIRQAQLSTAGIGLEANDDILEIIRRLFTDEEFCTRVADASDIETERTLNPTFGYRGHVDVILDGVPYELKTSRNPSQSYRRQHAHQLKLYLFVLLLEELDDGDRLTDELTDQPEGYLIYTGQEETDNVQYEPISLSVDDVATFTSQRNEVARARDSFGVPSPYNRDCEHCHHRHSQSLPGSGEELAPACTHHCQSERRWQCYEVEADGGVISDCSLFDECGQRLEFRTPEKVDHYNRLRAALRNERSARLAGETVLDRLDRDVKRRSGRLLTGLILKGTTGGDILRFETDESVVPGFGPGDRVTLSPESHWAPGDTATFYGRNNEGEFLFKFPLGRGRDFLRRYLGDEETFEAQHALNTDIVDRRFLPYLDYAQRREYNPRFTTERTDTSVGDGQILLEQPGTVTEYLDRTELFVDVPVRSDRNSVIRDLISSLVTTPYLDLDDTSVPEDGRRALILGATPADVELIMQAVPDGDHYRMDGTVHGDQAIIASQGHHEIQQRLLASRSLVSSVQHALESEVFHNLKEGQFGNREHSTRFFDVLVLVGAERLTEPEYLFLSDLADRVVSIGNQRNQGPKMVSKEAVENGLAESYYAWAQQQYASLPVEDAASLQLEGEANAFVQKLEPSGPWSTVNTTFSFLDVQGSEDVEFESFEFQITLPTHSETPHRLVLDVSNTTADPFAVQDALLERDRLEIDLLPDQEIAVIEELPVFVAEKTRLENQYTDEHTIVIKGATIDTPQFSEAFLHNRIEAKVVAQAATSNPPDVIVTPYAMHATELREQLDKLGLDVPVILPGDLTGTIYTDAIVSFGVSHPQGILRPPLTDPDVLYMILSCAESITLVGDEETLASKDLLRWLIRDEAEPVAP
jgi:hypothetical protein